MQTVTFDHPFREAQGQILDASVATGVYQCAVAGHPYMLDLKTNLFAVETIDYMRTQQDNSATSGEGTLAATALWRRSMRSWHQGAGQTRADEAESLPYRFLSSKGVDPFTRWSLRLLNDTTISYATTGSPLGLAVVGSTMVAQSSVTLVSTTDGISWGLLYTMSGVPVTNPVSDGVNVYIATDDSTIRQVTMAGVDTTAWTMPDVPDSMGFAKGRLWVGAGNDLYPLTPGSTVVSALTHPWSEWRWTGICEGSSAVYACGYTGDKSQVYRIGIRPDGSGLDAGVVAATLPDGETAQAVGSYLGFILIGTTKGIRVAVPNVDGDLTYGPVIPTDSPVTCFEGQDRFIWFGWTDYDNASTGLGKIDLLTFTADLAPAYASDLMHPGAGAVTSTVTFGNKRYFSVVGQGIIGETSIPVPVGTLETSAFTYGLLDPKVASQVALTYEALHGAIQVALSVDGSGYGQIAEISTQGESGIGAPFTFDPVRGSKLSLELALLSSLTTSPVVTGMTLLARPSPPRTKRFTLPLMLSEQADTGQVFKPMDPEAERAFLESLVRAGAPITVQIGANAYQAFPVNFRWVPYRQIEAKNKQGWTGTFVLQLDEVTA